MAQVLGKSGRYVSDEAAKRASNIALTGVVVMGGVGFIGGALCGSQLRWIALNPSYCLAAIVVAVTAAFWVTYWSRKR
ncbi:MAG: hypothetical protein ACREFR_06555, partial [Limisphaerales bacterium]